MAACKPTYKQATLPGSPTDKPRLWQHIVHSVKQKQVLVADMTLQEILMSRRKVTTHCISPQVVTTVEAHGTEERESSSLQGVPVIHRCTTLHNTAT